MDDTNIRSQNRALNIDEFENETKEQALKSAVKQINERQYETAILKRGIKDILKLGVIFDGKRVWAKEG